MADIIEVAGIDRCPLLIPCDVTEIRNSAFEKCTGITLVIISKGVKVIGNRAFFRCEDLESVVIPEGITDIGESAFARCHNLKSVTIPSSVIHIGRNAFGCCGDLKKFQVVSGNTEYQCVDDVLFTRRKNTLFEQTNVMLHSYFSRKRRYVVPDHVTTIEDYAFWCCELFDITIPATVTSIRPYAFEACDNVTIHTPAGSVAEQYAKENGIPVAYIAE